MYDWRSALLRRLARRFHIGDDVLRHLSTFQRLGERFEIEAPTEMLPVGARTIVRALRTRSAAQIRPDWLWPLWLERQLDPESPAFVPRGHLPFAANVTLRNWTAVGNPWSAWEAIVDPAGLVTPGHDTWSLDWWVQADGEWHLPSRHSGVRQRLVESRPVVETSMPIPGGEAAQRVHAVRVDAGELVVVEVLNRTDRPASAAFAVRPYNPEGLAVVERVAVDAGRIEVDGSLAVLLPAAPADVVVAGYHLGDGLHRLERGGGRGELPLVVDDPAGFAQAVVVFPLPPGESVRVALPLPPGSVGDPVDVAALPEAGDTARAWGGAITRDVRVELPDAALQSAVESNQASLLLLHDPGDITAGPATYHRFWFRDAAYQLVALDRWGFHEEVVDVLRSYPSRQRADGFFYSQWREWDANGAALWAVAEHHRLTGDDDLVRELAPSLRAGVNWIARKRMTSAEAPIRGLLPAGVSAEHLGPFDYYYWDDFWALRGLLDGAYLARVLDERDAARRIEREAAAFREDILASVRQAARDLEETVIPAGPFRGIDAGMIGSLVACEPLGLLAGDDPLVDGTLTVLRERFCVGPAFYQAVSHTGLGTYLTLQLAFVELARGEAVAWDRMRWLLDAATPTWTWPEAIHPQLGGGCMGDGHHGWVAADVLNFVRSLLVSERADGGIDLLRVLPAEWQGRELVVEALPTHGGRLTYEVRWEGDRPLLAWEWEGRGARLHAPGLDPSWSSEAHAGEAALSPLP